MLLGAVWVVSLLVGTPSTGQTVLCDVGGSCAEVFERETVGFLGAASGFFSFVLVAVAAIRWLRAGQAASRRSSTQSEVGASRTFRDRKRLAVLQLSMGVAVVASLAIITVAILGRGGGLNADRLALPTRIVLVLISLPVLALTARVYWGASRARLVVGRAGVVIVNYNATFSLPPGKVAQFAAGRSNGRGLTGVVANVRGAADIPVDALGRFSTDGLRQVLGELNDAIRDCT